MKRDLDHLMETRGLDAIVVTGGEGENPALHYLTNGAHITGGYAIKPRGGDVLLVVNPMETEEAAKSGLTTLSYNDFDWAKLVEQAQGDRAKAAVSIWGAMLKRAGVESGKIGLYGTGEINHYIALIDQLRETYPEYEFRGEMGKSIFDEAYVTKDADEILRLRSVAARTSEVLQATWDYIASHHANGAGVVDAYGEPLTIAAVKRFVRRALLDRDLIDTGMIFAQGRDAGFPHSRGEDDQPLQTGQSIVFDLFPREIGGGYFHDVTRTWSIGHATPEVEQIYAEVMDAFEVAVDSFRAGVPGKALQLAVMDYFESKGHPTPRSHPGTNEGYVHSLGHGIGLNIHERPSLSHHSEDALISGSVITIEPGLYYPDSGFGVRIEDAAYVDERGMLITLTDFHKDLVIPLAGE